MKPTQPTEKPYLTPAQLLKNIENDRATQQEAGIAWPPNPWQQVRIPSCGAVVGTVVAVLDGLYSVSYRDDDTPKDFHLLTELRLEELQPLRELMPGWVPVALWEKHLYDAAHPQALDLLRNDEGGHYAFNYWPKMKPPRFFYFLGMDKPYRQYCEHEIAAVRPSEG